MLSIADRALIYQKAYLPEHLWVYVEAISGGRAHLRDNYLCYVCEDHLIFVGYPLDTPGSDIDAAFQSAWKHFATGTAAVIAPEVELSARYMELDAPDDYYRIQLPAPPAGAKVANMLRRAERELQVVSGRFQWEHRRLVNEFIKTHSLTEAQNLIYRRIGAYLKRSKTARVLEARKGARLAAFSVVDLDSADCAFYMFNFRSPKTVVPGASDLLFHKMLRLAIRSQTGGQPWFGFAFRRTPVQGKMGRPAFCSPLLGHDLQGQAEDADICLGRVDGSS